MMGSVHQPLLLFVTFLIAFLSITSLIEGQTTRFKKSDELSKVNGEKIAHFHHGLKPGRFPFPFPGGILGFPGSIWGIPLGWWGGFPGGRGFQGGLGGFPGGVGGFARGNGGFLGGPGGLGGLPGGPGGFLGLAHGYAGKPEVKGKEKPRRNPFP